MTNLQIIILSALQGFTEFLPVSSSGHLILLSKFTSFPDQGLEIDIAVHVGSILAVMIYFWRDIRDMLYGLVNAFFNRFPSVKNFYLRKASAAAKDFILNQLPAADLRLLLMLVVGTVPAVVFGLALHHFGMEWLRSTKIIGWNILLFGILLWIADRFQPSKRSIADMTYKDAFLIGLAQCLAMIPGTSRSGITITASRFLRLRSRQILHAAFGSRHRRRRSSGCRRDLAERQLRKPALCLKRYRLFFHRFNRGHFHYDEMAEKLYLSAVCHLPCRPRNIPFAPFVRLHLTFLSSATKSFRRFFFKGAPSQCRPRLKGISNSNQTQTAWLTINGTKPIICQPASASFLIDS